METSTLSRRKTGVGLLEFAMNNKALLIAVVLVVIASILSPNFFTTRNIFNILRQISASVVLGAGFTLVLASGNLDLSVGLMLGMIGIIMAKLDTQLHVPFPAMIVICVVVGVICGAINGSIISWFKLPAFVVTLATGQIFKGINYVVSNTSAISGLTGGFEKVGQGYIGPVPIPVYIMLAVSLAVGIVFYKTAFGRRILAVGGNPDAARVSGLNLSALRIGVYAIMGACVAIASLIVTSRALSAQPAAGQGMEMDAIAAVVIGGTPIGGGFGKPEGTIFGCIIIGLINNILNLMSVDTNWQLLFKGVIILLAVLMDYSSEKVLAKLRNRV
ncbi:ABC transporter permease [Feifania hominis]|uniref:ABC transporter permease n=1 Tax=Feifania hominis TaxID=2763660 RepID=A0A926HQ53_9FIRM|nr:ABC transporter permease [Feifania hominis]MBC8535982.1 ABC transporter permease [Feifania hominis]